MKTYNKRYALDDKIYDEIIKSTIKCKCGHSVLFGKLDKRICSWCGAMVYKDKKEEFRDKLRREIRKNEKNV